MKLVHIKGWTGEEEVISGYTSESEISDFINLLDWEEFNAVRLEIDSRNWMDASGNLSGDGLAIIYEENGIQFISNDAPESIQQLESTLLLYLKKDKRFRDIGFSSLSVNSSLSTDKKADDRSWKIRYDAKEKSNSQSHRITLLLALLIIGFFGSAVHLWFTDELKFVGRDSDFVTANVYDISWKPGKIGYTQRISYEFEIEGIRYVGYFRGDKFTGEHSVGDKLKVKYVTDRPSISKRIATYKRQQKADNL